MGNAFYRIVTLGAVGVSGMAMSDIDARIERKIDQFIEQKVEDFMIQQVLPRATTALEELVKKEVETVLPPQVDDTVNRKMATVPQSLLEHVDKHVDKHVEDQIERSLSTRLSPMVSSTPVNQFRDSPSTFSSGPRWPST